MAHETLNQALLAGGVDLDIIPLGVALGYGESLRLVSNGLFVGVCRFDNGTYETAISYASQCDDMVRVIKSDC